ncbi:MAG TPA: ABC transporter permease subunit [Pseudobacteroides sp.]|uniref:ABC transporter permease subunit n=1 Tax=Pseudobacteroides sp. TaxID=1968840 RepID=UPI002F934297
MNMFFHELRANRKNTGIWAGSITALIVFYMSMFPLISKDASTFQKLLENYPEPLRKAFGASISSIGTILGFYSFIFVLVLLIGAIQAMNLGTSILSKESRERTADFLLTKPVSRTRIMTSKLMAAFILIMATNIICYIAAVIMANVVKTQDYNELVFFMINATLFFVQIIFFVLGIIISVFFQRLRSVLPISLGAVFGFFFIGMFIATDKDDAARFITPFKYFDTGYIINNSSYEASYLIAAASFIIVAVAASYIIYSKKDIHAV